MMILNTSSIEVNTPDGIMFCNVVEDVTGRPVRLMVEIGKTGTAIKSWTLAVTHLINLLLDKNVDIKEIMNSVMSIPTPHSRMNKSGNVRSGPDGIAYAIYVYLRGKHVETTGLAYFNEPWK